MKLIEDKNVEFKREYSDSIKYTVIAFANTEGGKIYIGINDDGSVCGIDDIDNTLLQVSNMIKDVVRPDVTMFTELDVQNEDNKNIIVVTVQRGTSRPYYLYQKGVRPEGVYVRYGAASVPASQSSILNMIKETSNYCFEDALSLNQKLTFKKAIEYFAKKKLKFGDQQKRTLHLINEDGNYTNLAMLLSDQCNHTIKIAVYEGGSKTVFRDSKELKGSLLEQIEDGFAYIDKYNRTRAEFTGLERIDKKDYPIEAIREAFLNAVVHRDYSINGSSLISIFDDRVEFLSIGGLVSGIAFDDIMLGVSALRNKDLANIFYRLKFIEAYGTGIMKINECYINEQDKPTIKVSSNAFKIVLPNLNNKEAAVDNQKTMNTHLLSKSERADKVISLFERKSAIVRKDVEDALEISSSTAGVLLREMISNKLIEKEGIGRNSYYKKILKSNS